MNCSKCGREFEAGDPLYWFDRTADLVCQKCANPPVRPKEPPIVLLREDRDPDDPGGAVLSRYARYAFLALSGGLCGWILGDLVGRLFDAP